MKSLQQVWEELFQSLSSFGYEEGQGTTRLSWSKEFLDAQAFLLDYAKGIGLCCKKDGWGNLFLTVPGTEDLPPVYTGSHLDSVPHGGKYDGALGITVPLAIANFWHQEKFQPRRPLTIIAFAEEEGTRFGRPCLGSQSLIGLLRKEDVETWQTADGKSLAELLHQADLQGDPFKDHLPEGKCFLELHIEQGRALEDAHLPLGVVSAIVGIRHYQFTWEGVTNHAGTTAMKDRHDALAAAAAMIEKIYTYAKTSSTPKMLKENPDFAIVGTVGQVKAEPGAANVVPGKAEHSLEIRCSTEQGLDRAIANYKAEAEAIAQEYGVTCEIRQLDQIPPAPMFRPLMQKFEKAAKDLGIPYQIQPSWAGHDSMILSHRLPTAMLFVPSKNGISHSPEEYTDANDIGQAASVLKKVLEELTRE
ncbi:M20 family metallo-hydrolase [Acidaminococcus timonensis]|uniref:M20 family metallo-hydrolase n=1 Tax=Acidaminococcus timonensis TaxID=1871002 RepID=UPI002598B70A|nr:M20 family metallo-hydrolase [uncultured Acidaminococcus sp.]